MKLFLIVDITLTVQIVSLLRNVSTLYRECEGPWFGPHCRYRCRCATGKCANGSCIGTDTCDKGWFGPQCQFIDLAYQDDNSPTLTDNNISTCNGDSSLTIIPITFKSPFMFTWIRMVFASSGSHNVSVYFKADDPSKGCEKTTDHTHNHTLDIYCHVKKKIDRLFVSGQVADMCSLLVSGGRNIALRQASRQSSTYSEKYNATDNTTVTYPAENAVDGVSESGDDEWTWCASTAHNNKTSETWSLTLARAAVVDKYVILMSEVPAVGWKLTLNAVNSLRQTVFTFMAIDVKTNITIVNRATDVSSVIITAEKDGLRLCEVEVYGDTICKDGYFGRDCEHKCYCLRNSSCVTSTGACPQGCAPGFQGPSCSSICDSGSYGQDCQGNCSETCVAMGDGVTSCNYVTGHCLKGCEVGYQPPFCHLLCPVGRYGQDCKYKCSSTCNISFPLDDDNPYCNVSSGDCIFGCLSGYIGDDCSINTQCKDGYFGRECQHKCNCRADSSCLAITGICPEGCAPGFRGPSCTLVCEEGSYGQDCLGNCSETCVAMTDGVTSCNSVTGHCLKGCEVGYQLPLCELPCPVGKFGQDCKFPCSSACIKCKDDNSSYCNAVNGTCVFGCTRGYIGHDCFTMCPVGRFGQDCKSPCSSSCVIPSEGNSSYCNASSGACVFGCTSGHTGDNCSTVCPVGTFGPNCKSPCRSSCNIPLNDNSTYCNASSGICVFGCSGGYRGPDCSTVCDPGSFGLDCTLRCSAACVIPENSTTTYCHNINGTCIFGCSSGYTGSECFLPCKVGFYGIGCRLRCSLGCVAPISQGDPYCDHVNGSCARGCIFGYTGEMCTLKSSVTYEPSSVSRIVIVSVISSVGLIIITTLVFLLRRRHSYHSEEESS